MTDHTYIFKVQCKHCEQIKIEKVFLSMYIEPEIVWQTYLLLSGRSSYTCKDCMLSFIRKIGAYL